MTTFAELGLDPDLVDALASQGIEKPFPIQELTIPDAVAGRDVCGKAKTGSGKTLAFGLPMVMALPDPDDIQHGPAGLALCPTRELAIQVAEVLEMLAKVKGHTVTAVYGGEKIEKQIKSIEDGTGIIVATPGRLIDLLQRGDVKLDEVKMVAVDEADRMADMGFLPQVEWVLRHVPGGHQTLLFSATLDGSVGALVDRYQTDPVTKEVVSESVTVEQMHHRFLRVHEMDKAKVAGAIVANGNRTLIFSNTKRAADRLAADLEKLDVRAEPIHGDLPQRAREKALKRFADGTIQALVASDVAARGLDIDEIDTVVHWDPAPDHKTYLHRSGRTARAGTDGVAVTLLEWNEEMAVKLLQRRLGLEDHPIVDMFSNDERLHDLAGWDPLASD
ncbi:DEAD/DEAH box helicase [Actinospongicola halichondriae]|uniref:DEAD/DEAH box helicase n=1 Tax=Actinospongicola halichondriae TaxID=3236844 RepID=UPI003D56B9C1